MEPLKLACFDAEDLAVVSAHLQDALVRVGDLTYLPGRGRFALALRRFDWEADGTEPRRRLTGLQGDHVLAARTRGIDRAKTDVPLNLLAVTFEPGETPAGCVKLVFSGEACIRLDVACVEACMTDLGPVWAAASRPVHDVESA